MLHAQEFALLEVITEIESIIIKFVFIQDKVSSIFSRLFLDNIEIFFQVIQSLYALSEIWFWVSSQET